MKAYTFWFNLSKVPSSTSALYLPRVLRSVTRHIRCVLDPSPWWRPVTAWGLLPTLSIYENSPGINSPLFTPSAMRLSSESHDSLTTLLKEESDYWRTLLVLKKAKWICTSVKTTNHCTQIDVAREWIKICDPPAKVINFLAKNG